MRWATFVLLAACGRVSFEPLSDLAGDAADAGDAGGTFSIAQRAYLKASNAGPAGAGDEFGYSVALSGDTLVVGARMEDGDGSSEASEAAPLSGAVYVFVRSGTSWVQQAYLKTTSGDSDDRFGGAVAISGDTIVVGARFEDCSCRGVGIGGSDDAAPESGAAYVFVRSGSTWTQQAYFKSSDSDADDSFGYAVAIDGDTIAVGALQADGPTNTQLERGAVYVFHRNGGVWTEQAALVGAAAPAGARFGRAVAIEGNRIVVGAYLEPSGAAYVFERSGMTWGETARLVAANADVGDGFGFSVALSGATIAIGARDESSAATGVDGDAANNSAPVSGAVYVFDNPSGSWVQSAYVKASNTDPDDQFGFSVALDGDALVVGAVSEKSLATGVDGNQLDNSSTLPIPGGALPSGPGAAYLFQRTAGVWSQRAYLKASNTVNDHSTGTPPTGNQFGYAVALDASTVAVGAMYEDSPGIGVEGTQGQPGPGANGPAENSGAVYVFE